MQPSMFPLEKAFALSVAAKSTYSSSSIDLIPSARSSANDLAFSMVSASSLALDNCSSNPLRCTSTVISPEDFPSSFSILFTSFYMVFHCLSGGIPLRSLGFCVTFEVRSQIKYKNPLFLGYAPGKAGFLYPFSGYNGSIYQVLGTFKDNVPSFWYFGFLHSF